MKIEELLDKYFEGETSCQEERELRRFFHEEPIPQHLKVYQPLFAYIEKEVQKKTKQRIAPTSRRLWMRTLSGVAAALLLLCGIGQLIRPITPAADSYVIIGGTRHTDAALVKAKALEAMQMVGYTDEDLHELLFAH